MKRRFKPKEWPRPRSRRAREGPATPMAAYRILRDLYPAPGDIIWDYPAWAKTAIKFGWMTRREFYALERIDTGRRAVGFTQMLYESMPLFGLIKKERAA